MNGADAAAESRPIESDSSLAGTRPLVDRKEHIADGIVHIVLRGGSRGPLPSWSPGAHIVLPDGTTRQYSLCGDPADAAHYELAVQRAPESRRGSVYVDDVLAEGDTIEVSGPRNNFLFVGADRYVVLAGGIGIRPLVPMIRCAQSIRREWSLT
ncbi:hypothetical protein GCM10023175_63710 [Pseudonocardia xishanensis]|uniref:FAD-binding FR-type domain-containing protein n=1 Tax=Pseudonocardia xishanensis TaxID=630995 RepID=A0ABP8S296_9PSEU